MLTLIKGIQKSPTLNTLYAIKPVRFNAIKSKLSPTTLEKWGGGKKKMYEKYASEHYRQFKGQLDPRM